MYRSSQNTYRRTFISEEVYFGRLRCKFFKQKNWRSKVFYLEKVYTIAVHFVAQKSKRVLYFPAFSDVKQLNRQWAEWHFYLWVGYVCVGVPIVFSSGGKGIWQWHFKRNSFTHRWSKGQRSSSAKWPKQNGQAWDCLLLACRRRS